VKVFKELEDLDRPIRATAGAAIFRADNLIERQSEVIDASVYEVMWIPVGRDEKLEQEILRRIAHFKPANCPSTWRTSFDRFSNGLFHRPTPPTDPVTPAPAPAPAAIPGSPPIIPAPPSGPPVN
jgi:hypothetical protein